jgi:hypothetical protein
MALEIYSKGKLNGVKKVFYNTEKIAEEANYVNGVKQGSYKKYAENGVLMEEATFKNGEYDGKATFQTSEKKITGQGVFKNGKKVGMWKILEDGKLKNVNMNLQGKKFEKRTKPVENYGGN